MNILLADDEKLQLTRLEEAVKEACPGANIFSYSNSVQALEENKDKIDRLTKLLTYQYEIEPIVYTKNIKGNIYTFNKISENDQAIIAHGDVKAVKLPANIKTHTLVDKKAKGEVVIKDNIYTGARFFYIVSKIAIPIFFGCAASSIVLFILSASIKSASTLFRVIASIVLSIGALAILVHGVWEIACRLSDNYLLLKPKPIIRRRKK